MKKTTLASFEENQKNLDFVLSRLRLDKSQIEINKIQQQEIDKNDLKLLTYVNLESSCNTYEKFLENSNYQCKKELLKKVNFIKQKIDLLQKCRSKIEKDLFLDDDLNKKNGLSNHQVKETQQNRMSQQPQKFSNLVLNMDYKLNLAKACRSKDDYDFEKQFILKKVDKTTQATIYATDSNQLRVYCQASDYKFANKNRVSNYFQCLVQIPHLAHISQYAIPLRTVEAACNLDNILKQVQLASLHLITAPPQFNFEILFSNLMLLNLELGVDPNIFTKQNLQHLLLSLKEAKMLAFLKLYFDNCIYRHPRDILHLIKIL
ncbi:hypothetical protein ABPG72_014697 [Tetrahymena utriculariae]